MTATLTPPLTTTVLLTAREAARSLSISERCLWQLTKDGLVAAVRIGRAVRYRPESLAQFAQESEQK